MKRVIIKNLEGIQTHGAEMEDPTQWIADCVAKNSWGLPEEYTIEIIDLDQDYDYQLEQCYAKRRAEYPPMQDYLDGVVKGDLKQQQAYIDACIAVKAKYPKPIAPSN